MPELINMSSKNEQLLEVKELKKYFPIQKGFFRKVVGFVKAVDDVSFTIDRGETVALVGESGCGKTTTGRLILRAIKSTSGEIIFHKLNSSVNLNEVSEHELKEYRKHMQLIFQDPYSSLNPRMTVLEIIGEPLLVNNIAKGKVLEKRVAELMELVGLDSKYLRRYPHAFSGGQRQRIGIARALALKPELVIADEPVSALDVSIQAQTLNLLKELQEQFNLTYLFISHDLSVVKFIADRVAVMYVGQIVEIAETEKIFKNPRHPYTEALLAAVPRILKEKKKDNIYLLGDVADPANPPSGCYFHPRCRYVKEQCKTEPTALKKVQNNHFVRCHLAGDLNLSGV
jgi:peptide/nickel transport system ATP-binding protein